MHQQNRHLYFSTLFFLCIYALISRPLSAQAPEFRISHIDHPEISGRHIYGIAGKNGKRAIALRDRIFMEAMDGTTQIFDPNNSPLLETGTVKSIALTDQELWAIQSAPSQRPGAFRFANNSWSVFQEPDAPGLLNGIIACLHVDDDQYVWLGYKKEGVSQFVEAVNPVLKSTKIMHLFDNELLSMHMQMTHLWIGTNNGVIRYRTEIKSNYDLNIDKWLFPAFPAREAFSISDFVNYSVVAGTSRGLAIFDGKTWSLKGKKDGIVGLPINLIQRDKDLLWLGSPVGLQLWGNNGPVAFFTSVDGLPSSNITALALDENGNLLVGTDKGAAIISALQPQGSP